LLCNAAGRPEQAQLLWTEADTIMTSSQDLTPPPSQATTPGGNGERRP
jgi:hypothetical protein